MKQQIEYRNPNDLLVYERNSRIHSKDQIDRIKGSVKEFGWTIPILLDENDVIIAGHARHQVAIELDMEAVPCLVASGWSEEKKRAYVIADNRLTEIGRWDFDILREELDFLQGTELPMEVLGFDDAFMEALELRPMFDGDDDGEANDPDAEWVGMPEFENEADAPYHSIKIHLRTEEDLEAFSKLIGRDLSSKPKFTYWPYTPPIKTVDIGFVDEDESVE